MKTKLSPFAVGCVAVGLFTLVAASAWAQDPPAPAAPAPPTAAPDGAEPLRPSLGFERVGGFSYTVASPDEGDDKVSANIFAIGGIVLNPYSAPRLGIDFPVAGNLTLGGSGSYSRTSLSMTANKKTEDVGSLSIYSLTPRIGYTFRPNPRFDLSLRAGVLLAGGSVEDVDGEGFSVFTTAADVEAVGAIRLNRSFHVLGGLAFDKTLSGTATATGGSGSSSSSNSEDIKGGLTTVQLWLGLGGYL